MQVQVLHNLKQVAEAEVQVKPAVHTNQQVVLLLVVMVVRQFQYSAQLLNLFILLMDLMLGQVLVEFLQVVAAVAVVADQVHQNQVVMVVVETAQTVQQQVMQV